MNLLTADQFSDWKLVAQGAEAVYLMEYEIQ